MVSCDFSGILNIANFNIFMQKYCNIENYFTLILCNLEMLRAFHRHTLHRLGMVFFLNYLTGQKCKYTIFFYFFLFLFIFIFFSVLYVFLTPPPLPGVP